MLIKFKEDLRKHLKSKAVLFGAYCMIVRTLKTNNVKFTNQFAVGKNNSTLDISVCVLNSVDLCIYFQGTDFR